MKNALQVIDFDEASTRVSHCITDVVYHCCCWLVSQSTHTCASVQHLFEVAASVLHLGNVQFDADGKGHALLNDRTDLDWVSNVRKRLTCSCSAQGCTRASCCFSWQLLGVDANKLQEDLTFRKIEAKCEQVRTHRSLLHFYYGMRLGSHI